MFLLGNTVFKGGVVIYSDGLKLPDVLGNTVFKGGVVIDCVLK